MKKIFMSLLIGFLKWTARNNENLWAYVLVSCVMGLIFGPMFSGLNLYNMIIGLLGGFFVGLFIGSFALSQNSC